MIILKYIGSAIKDYTQDEKTYKILKQDSIVDTDGTLIYKFKDTNDDYVKPILDVSQSVGCMIKDADKLNEFIIYYVDNNEFINYVYLSEYDDINNDYKIENVNTNIKAIKNKPLSFYVDNDRIKWIYFQSKTKAKAICRLNVETNIAEYVTDIDYGSIIQFDNNTGYGIYNINKESNVKNEIIMKSFINEKEINVPNNFYTSALAIKLAMAYKIKQNADISILSAQYDEMIDNFYDSISNDSWTNYRINNVY